MNCNDRDIAQHIDQFPAVFLDDMAEVGSVIGADILPVKLRHTMAYRHLRHVPIG